MRRPLSSIALTLMLGLVGCSAGSDVQSIVTDTAPAGQGHTTPSPSVPPANAGPSGGIIPPPNSGEFIEPTAPSAASPTPPPQTDCGTTLEITVRDFDVSHPDFEMPFAGDVVRRGLVKPDLGPDGKPMFQSSTGCPWDERTPLGCDNWEVEEPEIQSAETFDQWYRDVPGTNYTFVRSIRLEEVEPGAGRYRYSSNEFFPIGPDEGWGATPPPHLNQNFLFTTEAHVTFTYERGQVFSFFGDDDLWIFVNGRLALDLGGMHAQARGTIDFDAQASDLGIQPGRVYRMDIFHAERHTTASNFQIETTIGCFTPVPPPILK